MQKNYPTSTDIAHHLIPGSMRLPAKVVDKTKASAPTASSEGSNRRHHAKIWLTWKDEGDTVVCVCGTRYIFSRKNGSSSLLKHAKKCNETYLFYEKRREEFPFGTMSSEVSGLFAVYCRCYCA